jgi:putative heme-binding domain-containing protein
MHLPAVRIGSYSFIGLLAYALQIVCGMDAISAPPVTEGLLHAWDAYTAVSMTEHDSDRVGFWVSESGRGIRAEQTDKQYQPQRVAIGEHSVLRFDGDNDVFRIVGLNESLKSATVFVVAAPHSNQGDFRGFLSANGKNQRDYESGWNIDLGPGPSNRVNFVNIEGKGFGGAFNVLPGSGNPSGTSNQESLPFGELFVFRMSIDPSAKQVTTALNGIAKGTRSFTPNNLDMDELTLGARFYTNGPGEHQVRGPFHGDLACILIYDRVLSPTETEEVERYLADKYVSLNPLLKNTLPKSLDSTTPLVHVKNPPQVQMLVPGFDIKEIPVTLTNVNNIKYRPDGKLVALCYNGDIHLLSDENGDGLEDKAELFWKNTGGLRGPIGMVIAPPGYPKGQGVIVASKGKVSMIVDHDGDDRGDEELIVASGWQEIPQNVDAVGLTMAEDGSIYFGLGTANYANAYLIDGKGEAKYDLKSERGTVQKVSPDWKIRESVCTGIRFPMAFAFNRLGDLFCTEQEGATWMPNGNPLDELLHISLDGSFPKSNVAQKRHYGFPPFHPKHNPSVVDEPSTFDYGPQHQSTCGMFFNDPDANGVAFGPSHWHGDAIVTGESRGKLWRTKLAKSHVGYIADTQLITCLQMLTVDACLATNGDMIVACHSGPPDWGTGPEGIGKLFRITNRIPDFPRPVTVNVTSSSEVEIVFDKPLDPAQLSGVADKVIIEFGEFVRAGDRFENLVPPYAVVAHQLMQPRYKLPVQSLGLSHNNHVLRITTTKLSYNSHYAITIPYGSDEIDLDFSLKGIVSNWKAAYDSAKEWSGVLPHLDLNVSQAFLSDSIRHQMLWDSNLPPGTMSQSMILDLRNMLHPVVQPGSKLDYERSVEHVTIHLRGPRDLKIVAGLKDQALEVMTMAGQKDSSNETVEFAIPVKVEGENLLLPLQLAFSTGGTLPKTELWYTTSEDETARPFETRRFLLPWVDVSQRDPNGELTPNKNLPELAGGNWGRGKRVFEDNRALCSKCHAIHGSGGGGVGPDLSNLIHRDFVSVQRDVINPSYSINPDYLGFVVATTDSQTYTGAVRSDGDSIVIGDSSGKTVRIARSDIEGMKPMSQSVMPTELLDKLSEQEKRDLFTYLLTPAPSMPLDSPLKAPPVRLKAEVLAVLEGSEPVNKPQKPLQIVLVDGLKDHGPGEHDYPAWRLAWSDLLSAAPGLEVSTARDFPNEVQLNKADVLIFFQKGSFTATRGASLDRFLKRGGGLVLVHWAVNGDDRAADFARRIGLASTAGGISYRHGPLQLNVDKPEHPIMRNISRLDLYDESYWRLSGDVGQVQVLASSVEEGDATPQVWLKDHGGGRVFVSIPGHYNWTFDDPIFRILLLRGIAWTAQEPIDRFNELVWPGARVVD